MTEFALSLMGLHARNETTIQATQDWERGRIDSRALRATFQRDCDSLVALQRELATDYITDGQLTMSWQDSIAPLTSGLMGVAKGAMVRWYNTNTFYYTPMVVGPIESEGDALWSKLERRFVKKGLFRVTLPDPLTFSELAEDRHYGNHEKVLFAYADALNGELRTLVKNGVSYVQFSSPALVAHFRGKHYSKDQLMQLGEALRSAVRGVSLRTGFHTIFGDAARYLPHLLDVVPTDDIGFDFTQTDPLALSPTKKGIIAGVADSRTTYLETTEEMGEKVEQVLEKTGSRRITLAPSADLRYIPRVSADEKLRSLALLRREFGGR